MTVLRVTKYDPQHRDDLGYYTRDEWTAISDVGREYGGEVFTKEQYESTENAYLAAIEFFMRDAGVVEVQVSGLSNYDGLLLPGTGQEGMTLRGMEISEMARLVLRERAWCRLEARDKFSVHFGYDYYMYVLGDGVAIEHGAVEEVRSLGLFVEEVAVSPIRTEPDLD